MQKKFMLAVAIALSLALAALVSPLGAQAHSVTPDRGLTPMSGGGGGLPGTTVFHTSGQTATAFFASLNGDGTIETDVFVQTSQSVTHTPPSSQDKSAFAYVDIGQYDVTTGQPIMSAYGSAIPVDLQFGNQLSTASLTASMVVTPFYYTGDTWVEGAPVALSINIAWTATSDTEHLVSTTHYKSLNYTVNQHYNGMHRYAQAVGNVMTETTNYTPFATTSADLVLEKDGYTQIIFK